MTDVEDVAWTDAPVRAAIQTLRLTVWAADTGLAERELQEIATDEHDRHAHHYVLRAGGDVVASARTCVHGDRADVPSTFLYAPYELSAGPYASFNKLVVAAAWRRRGLARLLDDARLRCTGLTAPTVVTCVRDDRLPAVQALGFVVLGPAENSSDPSPLRRAGRWWVLQRRQPEVPREGLPDGVRRWDRRWR
jgi:hypothetical protein